MTTTESTTLDRRLDAALRAGWPWPSCAEPTLATWRRRPKRSTRKDFRCSSTRRLPPGELEALHAARQRLGDAALVGAGTVLDADDARAALHAAQLLVSPILAPDVMTAGVEAGVAVLPGAFTPTEIVAAGTAGARLVKLFPTAVFGPGV